MLRRQVNPLLIHNPNPYIYQTYLYSYTNGNVMYENEQDKKYNSGNNTLILLRYWL